jgi:hypothetical protein
MLENMQGFSSEIDMKRADTPDFVHLVAQV